MSAKILDGKQLAAEIKADLKLRISKIDTSKKELALGTVLVGDDAGSRKYVAGKHKDCSEVGIKSINIELPETAKDFEILQAVEMLNSDENCTGYIVQLPLPRHVNQRRIIESIDPNKDADGLHPRNLGYLAQNVSGKIATPLPCTPLGIVKLMRHYGVKLDGALVAILGRGVTVGRPLSLLLSTKDVNATVLQAHSGTKDIKSLTKQADIVISAIGKHGFLTAEHIKDGAVVLDVGVSRVFDETLGRYRVLGDVAKSVSEKASFISPNPGGVGPMTRAMLLENIMQIYSNSSHLLKS
ncbi:MAG: bifunctional methylenetetrahydrofolate dehydrogenase/methenyltetrahydrofolate cyclohydrolase [Bifidobacteriaceae bacterium]|jgi:methylenetetrahydrofolate dehydrogenase (NADP+)/methenyltetrahydrofolate cyclohydrolase|nr:bifunctional methylenetetrahydrofolate dehydrogenase/methenyltetrahydrofolate cyclohydrolase [Bifidobacteriaceae bacterium]